MYILILVESRCIHKKLYEEASLDKLTFELVVAVKKEYKNIAKHKRVLSPVVNSRIDLYINGCILDQDEVFVVDVFFESLVHAGKLPMFTCTCGIFGCGGYYVDVLHKAETVIWVTEQSPFADTAIHSSNRFIFSKSTILEFAEELVCKLVELNGILQKSGLKSWYELDEYKAMIRDFANGK